MSHHRGKYAGLGPTLLMIVSVSVCMADDSVTNPSPEDLRRFVTEFDGESRPDLVPFWLTIERALADAQHRNVLDQVMSTSDKALVESYRSAITENEKDDRELVGQAVKELCQQIDDVDGAQIGAEQSRMDQMTLQRRNARAQDLVSSLSTDGANALLGEATKAATSIKGANTDARALSREFPDYVKERFIQQCVATGYLRRAPDESD